MVTYVDTSTLLELIIDQEGSERALTIWSSADAVASVNLSTAEARAALAAANGVGGSLRRSSALQSRSAAALIVEATVLSSADAALRAAASLRGLHIADPLESRGARVLGFGVPVMVRHHARAAVRWRFTP